jgi:phage gp36-like protein
MIYATRSDIEALYGADELRGVLNLARDGVFGDEDIVRIDQALSESAGQIDAYIGARHSLPLPLVPEVLRAFAIDMAIYRLALRNGRPRDELRTRYEDAVKFLIAVSTGKASLPGIDTTNQPDSTAASGSSDDVQFITSGRRTNRNSGLMT